MNKKVTKAMQICSKLVREIPCSRCLHFEKCVRDMKPASKLGVFMAWLELHALPAIENELRPSCADGIKLEAYAPNKIEFNKGAYAVVRVYNGKEFKRVICRVLLTAYEYDYYKLRAMIFAAYFNSYRKYKNGKNAKN